MSGAEGLLPRPGSNHFAPLTARRSLAQQSPRRRWDHLAAGRPSAHVVLSTKRLGQCCRSSPHHPPECRPVHVSLAPWVTARPRRLTQLVRRRMGCGADVRRTSNGEPTPWTPAVNRTFTCADTHLRRPERGQGRGKRFNQFTDNLDFFARQRATRRPLAEPRQPSPVRARRRRRERSSRRPRGRARRPPSRTGSGSPAPPPAPRTPAPGCAARPGPTAPRPR